MKLDELQSVQSRERQTDQLQQLRATFYEEAGKFVAQLREERDRAAERADDPFDAPEVNRLTDDIKTAEQTVEAIYERRVGKIVKMASLAAADMPTEDGGLTQEERELFETMVEAIQGNRRHVLDVIAGESPAGAVGDDDTETTSPAATDATPTPAPDDGEPSPAKPADPTQADDSEPAVDAADIMGGGDGSATRSGDAGPTEPVSRDGGRQKWPVLHPANRPPRRRSRPNGLPRKRARRSTADTRSAESRTARSQLGPTPTWTARPSVSPTTWARYSASISAPTTSPRTTW